MINKNNRRGRGPHEADEEKIENEDEEIHKKTIKRKRTREKIQSLKSLF